MPLCYHAYNTFVAFKKMTNKHKITFKIKCLDLFLCQGGIKREAEISNKKDNSDEIFKKAKIHWKTEDYEPWKTLGDFFQEYYILKK